MAETYDLDIRKKSTLEEAFSRADDLLMKKYVANLSDYEIVPISSELKNRQVSEFTRLFKLERIVYDKDENNQDKLLNVYNAAYCCGGSVILLVDSDGEHTDFYLGTKNQEDSVTPAQAALTKAMEGNFPGSIATPLKNPEIEQTINGLFDTGFEMAKRSISAVSGIASSRDETYREREKFVQGIEKVLDSMRGEKYSLVMIADPISQAQIDTIQSGYEALYTQLSPFATTDLSFSENESSSITESLTKGVSESISENLSKTQTFSSGGSKSHNVTKQNGRNFGASVILLSAGASSGKSISDGVSESWNRSDGETRASGTVKGQSEQSGSSNTRSDGYGRNLQIKVENKSVRVLLDRIDDQIERLKECGNLGMWNCSAYFITDDMQTSKVLASAYQALIRGGKSGTESSAITTWTQRSKLALVEDYIKKLSHPLISTGAGNPLVSPSTLISGNELVIAAGLPQKSVPGLGVYKFAAFGREIVRHGGVSEPSFPLGKIFHMGSEENADVKIDCKSLASHTFVTGSTGAGKSNAIYQILDQLNERKIRFLVIEPAKGEYKDVFGGRSDVSVFGTNPEITPLLRINPFAFPKKVHVLEHIDRLIELFNVCWPMYAAMPAVLKESVERAYIAAGWELDSSENCFASPMFPGFTDVLEALEHVIRESAFSGEVKDNYTGALVTRVRSLTNGLNGCIFSCDEIPAENLFDENVIIDLSRIGSAETKAMIMGILIMRLQEHRMTQGGVNASLKHITVMEEAHCLLKRTSSDQNMEGANLLGKSVEMLSNAIAEMRTYGEGFVIADQAPGMLDLSVIRNTNTKIILRLPDRSDRELVGKAAGLNDQQIEELARLPKGVAAVYQNDWLEPVLCHVACFQGASAPYQLESVSRHTSASKLKRKLAEYFLSDIVAGHSELSPGQLRDEVLCSGLSVRMKRDLCGRLESEKPKTVEEISNLIYHLFDSDSAFERAKESQNIEQWNREILENLGSSVFGLDKCYRNVILQCLIMEKSYEIGEMDGMYGKWVEYMKGRALQ